MNIKVDDKLKEKLVHLCGGLMPYETMSYSREPVKMVRVDYPVQHLKVHFEHRIDDPPSCVDDIAAHLLGAHIIDNELFEHTTEMDQHNNVVDEYYDLWIAKPT